ncbi:hypothetical protein PR202_ga17263 [Eleusine coracana subsp. coracana]|uniref:Uncharacterized protein n=1 Tax=Eleusine coracana subsp. coracana TaxID=191504 RepID=A0AAV5CNQ5_ELECO|nr:hypothetical protein PR202_ga17263 [Eleusine coracana subsp. coracana]
MCLHHLSRRFQGGDHHRADPDPAGEASWGRTAGESCLMVWCGSAPSRQCMFPMTGSGHGLGGQRKPASWRESSKEFSLRRTVTTRRQRKV